MAIKKTIEMKNEAAQSTEKLLAAEGGLQVFYSPFDYVNPAAKVIIVGITPGTQQAENANRAYITALSKGMLHGEALKMAKSFASFSGEMRENLINMLDHSGLNHWLSIPSTKSLFDVDCDLAHFTSAIRYPTFLEGKNYTGKPSALQSPMLRRLIQQFFISEIKTLSSAIIIPLGVAVNEIVRHYVSQGMIDADRVLGGYQHPSNQSIERINVFLGKKRPEDCSTKTNGMAVLAGLASVRSKLAKLPAPTFG